MEECRSRKRERTEEAKYIVGLSRRELDIIGTLGAQDVSSVGKILDQETSKSGSVDVIRRLTFEENSESDVSIIFSDESPMVMETVLSVSLARLEKLSSSVVIVAKDEISVKGVSFDLSGLQLVEKVQSLSFITLLVELSKGVVVEKCVENFRGIFLESFLSIYPWDQNGTLRPLLVWVGLDDVPLQLWQDSFFEVIVGEWGSFIQMAKENESKENLQFVKVLYMVKHRENIPKEIFGKNFDVQFRNLVSIMLDDGDGGYEGSDAGMETQSPELEVKDMGVEHEGDPNMRSLEEGALILMDSQNFDDSTVQILVDEMEKVSVVGNISTGLVLK